MLYRRFVLVLILVLIGRLNTFSFEKHFKLIKTIGDDRGDFMFQRISGAVLTEQKDIIVSDMKGNFIAKYNWDGSFARRIGQRGQGPGDFLGPAQLRIYGKKLYLFDRFNSRFAKMDLNLGNLFYFKIDRTIFFRECFDVIDHDTFLATSFANVSDPRIEGFGKVLRINRRTGIEKTFFYLNPTGEEVDYSKNEKLAQKMDMFGEVIWGMDDARQKILISYVDPDNPVQFYLYTPDGRHLIDFQFQLDKRFSFPTKLIREKNLSLNSLQGMHIANIHSINFFAGNWYIFMETKDYQTHKDCLRNFFCLQFAGDGTFLGQFKVKDGLVVFYISRDGYVLARQPYPETEKLFVYKIVK